MTSQQPCLRCTNVKTFFYSKQFAKLLTTIYTRSLKKVPLWAGPLLQRQRGVPPSVLDPSIDCKFWRDEDHWLLEWGLCHQGVHYWDSLYHACPIPIPYSYISLTCLNPLSPKNDQHQISPCNLNANRVVMRIADMITQDEFAWYFINFSRLLL